jgi:hypothetical protein
VSRPWLYVTVDAQRRVALIRGDGKADVLRLDIVPRHLCQFSRAAQGWVIPIGYVPDVVAFGEYRGQLVVVTDRKEVA